jgi:riboflavin kinase/FMN adenylyltransferase
MRLFRGIPARADTPIALTIGNFDGVHRGHQAMVARLTTAARALGLPAAVMTFEPHPREFFTPAEAPARLTALRDKVARLGELGVDRVYVCRFDRAFASQSPEEFIEAGLVRGLGVRWLLVGDDFRFGGRRAGDADLLKRTGPAHGMTVETMHTVLVDGIRASSTAVREVLARGDMAAANRLLGHPYGITGRVVGGDRIGRELGFPTANVRMRFNRPPLDGIFAVEVHGAAPGPLMGAASLGVRPTVTDANRPTLEVFLLDFHGDVYGRSLRLDFLHRLRGEEKYPSFELLRAQIDRDVQATREFFAARAAAVASIPESVPSSLLS